MVIGSGVRRFAALAIFGPVMLLGQSGQTAQAGQRDARPHSVAMISIPQPNAPVRFVQSMHGATDWLEGGQVKNASRQAMTAYRVGWGYVLPQGIEYHQGELVELSPAVEERRETEVPRQKAAVRANAENFIFFVAEVMFADGTSWKATQEDIDTGYRTFCSASGAPCPR